MKNYRICKKANLALTKVNGKPTVFERDEALTSVAVFEYNGKIRQVVIEKVWKSKDGNKVLTGWDLGDETYYTFGQFNDALGKAPSKTFRIDQMRKI